MGDFWAGVAKTGIPMFGSVYDRQIRRREREEDKTEREKLRAAIQRREKETLAARAQFFRGAAEKTDIPPGVKGMYPMVDLGHKAGRPELKLLAAMEQDFGGQLEEAPGGMDWGGVPLTGLMAESLGAEEDYRRLQREMAERKAASIRKEVFREKKLLQGLYKDKEAAAKAAEEKKSQIAADLYAREPAHAAEIKGAVLGVTEQKLADKALPGLLDKLSIFLGGEAVKNYKKAYPTPRALADKLWAFREEIETGADSINKIKFFYKEIKKIDPDAAKQFEPKRLPSGRPSVAKSGEGDVFSPELKLMAARAEAVFEELAATPGAEGERARVKLMEIKKAYAALGPEEKQERTDFEVETSLLLGVGYTNLTEIISPDQAKEWLTHGKVPVPGADAPKETAEQTKTRLQFQHGIIRLDDLIQEADENDFTGLFPQLKSKLLDEILPAMTIDQFANWDRMTFRHRARILSQNLLRALNEEGKLSETDAERILPLTPLGSDDNPMFKAKLHGIRELLVAKLKLQDAAAGREDVFSLEPADFFSKLGKPNERLGGVIVIPQGMAPSIIKLMPQYQYIGGDKSKPVTPQYIIELVRAGDITKEQGIIWMQNAPGVFQRK